MLCYYLASVIIVPFLFALYYIPNTRRITSIDSVQDVIGLLMACILWPIIVPILMFLTVKEKNLRTLKDRAEDIKVKCRFNNSDRTSLVSIEEKDLKKLLKAYRKNQVALSDSDLITLRDELMHRNLEKNLLR